MDNIRIYCVLKDEELKVTGLTLKEAEELAKLINGEWSTESEAQFKFRRSLKHIPGLFNIGG